jgi:polygalacturonase
MKQESVSSPARHIGIIAATLLFSAALGHADAPAADAPSSPTGIVPKVFDVRALGARGDGKTLDTEAIQKALDACAKAGGGTVRIPAGTYLSQPLTLGDKTTLQLDEGAVVLASPDHKHFMKQPGDWLAAKSSGDFKPLLTGKDLTDIAITGKGAIDGNGSVWWEEAEKARQKKSGYTLPRPNLFTLQRCKNIKITGITLRNAPKFHFVPSECEDLLVDGVTVLAPEHAANTDGIDPSNCRNVNFIRCTFDVGDDDIAIKSGKKVEGREFGCENLTVTDSTFKHGHGMSIGSEVVGGVRNLVVKNCTFEDTDNGLRIKSRRDPTKGGGVENITYENCTLKNCHPAISIMCYYQDSTHDKFPKDDPAQPVTATTPKFRNITIRNVTGNSTVAVGYIVGLPESPIENVLLENVTLAGKEGLNIAYAKGVTLKNVKITPESGEPFLLHNAEVTGLPEGKK